MHQAPNGVDVRAVLGAVHMDGPYCVSSTKLTPNNHGVRWKWEETLYGPKGGFGIEDT